MQVDAYARPVGGARRFAKGYVHSACKGWMALQCCCFCELCVAESECKCKEKT